MSFEHATQQTSTATSLALAAEHVAGKIKEDDMKKIAYQLLIASFFVAALAPVAVWAQTTRLLNVDIPFQFRVGNTLLPAGKYTVEPVDVNEPDVLMFRGINSNAVAIVPTVPAERSTVLDKSDLKFDKIGNQEVLTKIWVGGREEGFQILESGSKTVAMASNSHSAHRSVAAKSNGM